MIKQILKTINGRQLSDVAQYHTERIRQALREVKMMKEVKSLLKRYKSLKSDLDKFTKLVELE